VVLGVGLILAACTSEPTPPNTPGIAVLQAPGPDTIDAILTTPLVVEVRGPDGHGLDSALVVFAGASSSDVGYAPEVLVGGVGSSDVAQFSGDFPVMTDEQGRASVQVQLGTRAPRGRVVVTVDVEPVIQDTIVFTIAPGAPVAARMQPKDTTVYLDRTLPLHGGVVDRHGNFRDEPVTYEAGPSLATTADGIVTPSAYARSWVLVRGAFGEDTGYVSVVPHGQALGVLNYVDGGPFVLFELDGSRYSTIPELAVGFDAAPAWSPDGQHFAYSTFSLTRETGGELFLTDSTGNAARLFPAGTFRNAAYPRYSRDGNWIYFSAQLQDGVFALWRVHPDGQGAEKLGTDLGGGGVDWRPDPSPDGSRLVFTTATNTEVTWGVRVVDLSSTQTSAWSAPGLTARWSPTGERIAVVSDRSGPLVLVQADGSSSREVTLGAALPGWQANGEPFDWSPDGQWLVLSHNYRIELLQVDTGLLLPLAWSSVLGQPTWRR
jgi:hypothetical protein